MNRPDESAPSRRTFLRVGAAAGAAYLSPGVIGTSPASAAVRKTRVYVLVLDGCGPDHATMLTGVLPDRHGIPADVIYDRRERTVRKLDRPGDLHYPTILERLQDKGLTTGSVLTGKHLSDVLGDRATYRSEPVLGHAAHRGAIDATLAMVERSDPDLLFVSLRDCDEPLPSMTGRTPQVARRASLVGVDAEVGRLIDLLQHTGRWRESVVIVVAGHTVSRTRQDPLTVFLPRLDADPLLAGQVQIVPSPGSASLYWTGPLDRHTEAVRRMRELAMDTPGVLSVHHPSELGLGARAGDVIAWFGTGRRFSDPSSYSDRMALFVTGGSPLVRHRTTLSIPARAVDVAPTVGRIFGLTEPRGGYDGISRL